MGGKRSPGHIINHHDRRGIQLVVMVVVPKVLERTIWPCKSYGCSHLLVLTTSFTFLQHRWGQVSGPVSHNDTKRVCVLADGADQPHDLAHQGVPACKSLQDISSVINHVSAMLLQVQVALWTGYGKDSTDIKHTWTATLTQDIADRHVPSPPSSKLSTTTAASLPYSCRREEASHLPRGLGKE